MRIAYDSKLDEAWVYLSEEKQSKEHGGTHLVCVPDNTLPEPRSINVQLGFEGNRLLFVIVRPASVALPADLLANATERGA